MSRPAPVAPAPLSAEEYGRLGESDEVRSELVRGVVVREPRPGAVHARTQVKLARRLDAHVEAEGLGHVFTDVGVKLTGEVPTNRAGARDGDEAEPGTGTPDTVRGPDVAFYTRDRLPEPLPEGFLERAPDLAAEIVSPSNTVSELLEKITDYLSAGTRLVWVIDPGARTATVVRSRQDIRILTEDETLEGGEVVPGFRVRLSEILP